MASSQVSMSSRVFGMLTYVFGKGTKRGTGQLSAKVWLSILFPLQPLPSTGDLSPWLSLPANCFSRPHRVPADDARNEDVSTFCDEELGCGGAETIIPAIRRQT